MRTFIYLKRKTITSKHVISLLRKQDEQGLAILYDQYSAALLGQIIRIVGNQNIAEEVLQQTMLKIWNGFSSYDESKAGLYAWMSRIARNTAIDKGRLKSFQQNQKTESIDSVVYKRAADVQTNAAIDVDRLTKNLDEKYKAVLDHVYLMGYTQAETSESLNIPLGTVKTRLRTAINILRDELKDEKKLFFGLLLMIMLLALMML